MQSQSTSVDTQADSNSSPTNTQMQQFVLLTKSARGAAVRNLVEQAVSEPGLYVFAELLNCESVQQLQNNEDGKKHWHLLNLFAYGTFATYKEQPSEYPPLSDVMLLKLRQLTIMSLAAQQPQISYQTLLEVLHLDSVRSLEDLIIDATYKNVIVDGKLDQRNQCVHISNCRGRDVRPDRLPHLIDTLTQWTERCAGLLTETEQQMRLADRQKAESIEEQAKIEEELINIKRTLKSSAGGRSQTPDFDEGAPPEVSSSKMGGPSRMHVKDSKRHKATGNQSVPLRGSAAASSSAAKGMSIFNNRN